MEANEEEAGRQWDERKSALMEGMLGKGHDMVMHALIPYGFGGGLDLYYYPHGIPGTAVATKELALMPGEGSSNDVFKSYELVMFTKLPVHLDGTKQNKAAKQAHKTINTILNCIAPYSAQATLNPNETCEFPADFEGVGGKCLIFDGYPSYSRDEEAEFGLLAIIEIFRSEMESARKNGGGELLRLLKERKHYPYSEMDREPVA